MDTTKNMYAFFWDQMGSDGLFAGRWAQFSRTEQLALAGCVRLVITLYPDRVQALSADMRLAVLQLSEELESAVRS